MSFVFVTTAAAGADTDNALYMQVVSYLCVCLCEDLNYECVCLFI